MPDQAAESSVSVTEVTRADQDLETAVTWIYETWAREKGASREETLEFYLAVISSDTERMLIAKAEDVPAGVVALVEHDVDHEPELTPWLSALFVAPPYRGTGVATRLMAAVEGRARALDFGRLYIYCRAGRLVQYYEAAGWRPLRGFERDGEPFSILWKSLDTEVDAGP